jgi:D-tyrosyl-tRNA(Tyr) deacylase
MRVVIQRVKQASVTSANKNSTINNGLLVFVGIEEQDKQEDIKWLSPKILKLRIFDDENGVMNKSVVDTGGSVLVISQFTLHASTKKGNRPSYVKAARPEQAIPLYNEFVNQLSLDLGKEIETGEFGAEMQVSLTNDGPVTILIDTKNKE